MPNPNMILLFVKSPEASVKFYRDSLNLNAIEESPTFAMLPLNDSTMLGLWATAGAEPKVTAAPGAMEIGVQVEDQNAVDQLFKEWEAKSVAITQSPTKLDFGYTFVGLDPDGHRIRIFTPEAP
jgi:catechol 2,3-dioxygenase-like lactoylglutathione lyase family enzyme